MKQLRRSLNAISKNLKDLTKRTDKLVKAVDKIEKAQAKASKTKKKPVKRAGIKRSFSKKPARKKIQPKKGKGISATETVLKIVNRSRKGIDTAAIQKKTGYNTRKIWDIVHRAYKEGKIKKVGRGTYVRA